MIKIQKRRCEDAVPLPINSSVVGQEHPCSAVRRCQPKNHLSSYDIRSMVFFHPAPSTRRFAPRGKREEEREKNRHKARRFASLNSDLFSLTTNLFDSRKDRQPAQNPEPRTQNPEPRTQNPEPRTQNPEPRTQNPEPRTQNPDPSISATLIPLCAFCVLLRLLISCSQSDPVPVQPDQA